MLELERIFESRGGFTIAITHGILNDISYKSVISECQEIEKLDFRNGYVKPAPIIRKYPERKYYPSREDEGRASPITGRGGAVYKKRWR